MQEFEKKDLIQQALLACKNSYSPYSHFAVGAALLTSDDKVYLGCNIENATYTPTICAERVAIFKALSLKDTEFKAIAIVGGKDGDCTGFCPPCGVCRQVMREFCSDDFLVILGNKNLEYREYKLSEILPLSFDKRFL